MDGTRRGFLKALAPGSVAIAAAVVVSPSILTHSSSLGRLKRYMSQVKQLVLITDPGLLEGTIVKLVRLGAGRGIVVGTFEGKDLDRLGRALSLLFPAAEIIKRPGCSLPMSGDVLPEVPELRRNRLDIRTMLVLQSEGSLEVLQQLIKGIVATTEYEAGFVGGFPDDESWEP